MDIYKVHRVRFTLFWRGMISDVIFRSINRSLDIIFEVKRI